MILLLILHLFVQFSTCTCPEGTTFYQGACTDCMVPVCAQCNNQLSICDTCMGGTPPASNACPNTCGVSNCETCSSYYTCSSCQPTYGLNSAKQCPDCQSNLCQLCYANYQKCEQCVKGKGVDENYQCVNCFSTCKTCNQGNYKYCLSCFIGFGLSSTTSSTTCLPCHNNFCLDCSDDYRICLSCQNISSNVGGVCIKCEQPCITCSSTPQYCTSCQDGYFLNSGQCKSCPMFYLTCQLNSANKIICLTKTPDAQFYFDGPVTKCRQICGDSRTRSYACDNQKDIALDGCDNNCDQMDNFSCSVVNQITECGYFETLYVDLISFQKQKFSNKFTFTFQIVSPILYSFLSLTQSTAKSMFKLDHPQVDVFTVHFNISTNKLIFNGELLDDLVDFKTINIRFHQSVVDDQIVPIPFIFTDDNTPIYITKLQFLVYNIIFYASHLASFLAWVSFVLGLVLRKLHGLQILIMLQLCWMSVVWSSTKAFFIAIYQSSALKLASSLNLALFEQSKMQVSFLSSFPYFQSYGILDKLFINNFNLSVLFIILPALTSLFFFFKIKREQGPKQFFEFQKIETKPRKTEKYLKYSLTVLFQGCMALLPYFVWCFLLFVKMGILIHIPSLIMIGFYGACFLWTFILYLWKPYLFDYFVLSFVFKRLALKHWMFHILVVLLVVSSLVMLPEKTYVPLIPCSIMMIFTILYRPYSSQKQNFASSFNYLVLCSFSLFRLLLGYLPIESRKNRILLTLILLVCIILCLAATIISNAFMITNFFEIKVLSKIEAATNSSLIKKNIRRQFLEQIYGLNIDHKVKSSELNRYKKILPNSTTLKNCSNALNMQDMISMVTRKLIKVDTQNKHSSDCANEIQKKKLKLSEIKKELMLQTSSKKKCSNQQDENRIIDYEFTYIEEEQQPKEKGERNVESGVIEQREENNVEMIGMQVLKNEYKHINISSIILNYGLSNTDNPKPAEQQQKKQSGKSGEQEQNNKCFLQIYEQI